MNSVFEKFNSTNNMNMIEQIAMIKKNPAQIGQLLFNSGKINQSEFEKIKNMNNPKDIAMFLMGQNDQFKQAYNMMKTFKM